MNEQQFDQLLREVSKERMNDVPPPPTSADEAWQKIQITMEMNRMRKGRRRKVVFSVLGAALILFAFMIISTPQNGLAFDRVTALFSSLRETVIGPILQVNDDEELHEYESETYAEETSGDGLFNLTDYEEAIRMVSFDYIAMEPIPERFEFSHARMIQPEEDLTLRITLVYETDQEEYLQIEHTNKADGFGHSFGLGMESEVEQRMIGQQEVMIFSFENGDHMAYWETEDMVYSIRGPITYDEIRELLDQTIEKQSAQ